MAKFKIQALDEYQIALSKLGEQSERVAKMAIYEGANVVADAIKEALKGLPIEETASGFSPFKKDGEMLVGVTKIQRDDLVNSMGLATMEERDGYYHTKVGWDGYGRVKTKSYPKGLPNQLLMRSVESGASFRRKNPVVRKATASVRMQAINKINETIDKEIKEIMEV